MTSNSLHRVTTWARVAALAVCAAALVSADARAQQTVNLIAAPFNKSIALPNGASATVPMWAFGLDADGSGVIDGTETYSVPGPRLVVPPGATTLTINLKNLLPEPVSIMIPGQQASGSPVVVDGRVRSMAPEAPPNGSASYVFANLKPGTYLYHSASHPAVQVQMGLYGALTLDASAGEAYPGLAYANEVLLLLSEVDVALHRAVASGTYGDPVAGGPTSTVDYDPSIFLVNGESYTTAASAIPAGSVGARTLVRMVNAGLDSHVVLLDGASLTLVAEDGNGYADARGQSAVLVPAGKTHDAVWMPVMAGDYTVYDRTLRLEAAGQPAGGMLATLKVAEVAGGPSSSPVSASPDTISTAEDAPLTSAPSVLGNDTGTGLTAELYSQPLAGTLTFNADGTFSYTPRPNFSGADAFQYRAVSGADRSAPTVVTIVVTPMPDKPTAYPLSLGLDENGSKPVTMTALDPDGDPVTFYVRTLPAHGSLLLSAPNRVAIASVAPGNPATITTATPHNFASGQTVILSGTTTSPDVNGNRVATVVDATTFTIPVDITAGQAVAGGMAEAVVQRPLSAADLFQTAALPGAPIPGGTLVYAPSPAYTGADSFDFVAGDGTAIGAGLVSDPAQVSLAVEPIPSAGPTGSPITLTVLGVDPRNPSAPPTPVTDYAWTLEEDRTYRVQPGVLDPETLSVGFHRSYMPVRQTGTQTSQPLADPSARYFVSVLPKSGGYSNGGAPVAAGQTSVTVFVNLGPVPTAQVRVRVFEDNSPLNNAHEADEAPLQGFAVSLDDAGGRYGMSGGQMILDAFGNPLGTTYKACPTPGACASYEIDTRGDGLLRTDAQGFATFENLRPGKYTVKVIPPAGEGWQQTSTIEGTKGIDAWVKANEPTYFTEFGPAGPHVEIGFVRPTNLLTAGAGTRTLTGTITNLHQSRPPAFQMFSGAPFDFTRAWVALNEGIDGRLVYAQPTNEDGTFTIDGVPPGSYTLGVFDSALDVIFATRSVIVSPTDPGTIALNDIPVFSWFTRLYHYVFEDLNRNGIRDAGERGIPEMAVNTRWRDGSVYQSSATDGSGFVPFEETFPFFAWQVAEVDYARFRATGVTVVVDNGGNVSTDTTWPDQVRADTDYRVLAPQPQTATAAWAPNETPTFNGKARTEVGPVLLEGFQGFIGMTNVFLWGKAPYDAAGSHATDVDAAPFDDFPGPDDVDYNGNRRFDTDEFSGGISGIVHYSTTRAENNARWGAAEPWEPGVPGVRVQLWDASRTRLLNEVTTDSWDDGLPAGCQGEAFSYLTVARDCYDGMRNWNQVRPAVFDGGYAFLTMRQDSKDSATFNLPFDQRTAEVPLPAGDYIVKVIVPQGYQLVKEQDKNVDFGDEYVPAQFLLSGYPLADAGGASDAPTRERAFSDPLQAPFCVGSLQAVPAELALFPGVATAHGGDQLPLCDEKLVGLRAGSNAAANFFLFTEAPVAGHIIGFVLDDTANEFDPNSPQFGEKYAPPWLPISIRDWTGREISHTYTDRYGVYNALVPSTFTANTPMPSGMTPSMLTACINSPLMAGPSGALVPDPFYNKQYSQFCYTLQYMPGTTTYLDTPVVPTGAFAGPGQAALDAELPDMTPVVYSVTQGTDPNGGIGPYIVDRPLQPASRTITIRSEGPTSVANPAFDANIPDGAGNPRMITRDYGFGSIEGEVIVGTTRIPAADVTWTDAQITAVVPTGTPTGQLTVVRCLDAACAAASRRPSVTGVTLTVADPISAALNPPKTVTAGGRIQAAIDLAQPGDLVLVPPGTYEELVIMDKPVRLQGWGAASTIINAVKSPAEKLQAWRDRLTATLGAPGNAAYLLDFQAAELAVALQTPDPGGENLGPILGGEGAAVTVLGKRTPVLGSACPQIPRLLSDGFGLQLESLRLRPRARIDGFGITGSDQAAGIEINANACDLEVLNNRIYSNTGDLASGVRIGHPGAPVDLADQPANNDRVRVAFNHILQNTSVGYDAGGAIAIGTGAPGYSVADNFVAGNFTFGRGAGVAHVGLSNNGTIARNRIVFNEVFNPDLARSGGGVYVGGRPPAANQLTPGAGNVAVVNNLIQGNAAIGDGGGVALAYVNGAEGAANRFRVDLFGNFIVNNVSGLAGGGVSLQDAVNVQIFHTTIAHNDSIATAGAAFANGPNQSTPQPAGIASRANSSLLTGAGTFSNPVVWNSSVWENRSFSFGPIPCPDPANPACGTLNRDGLGPQYGLIPATADPQHPVAPYWDFGVIGASGSIQLTYSTATSLAGTSGDNNTTTAPSFVETYFNGDRRQSIITPDDTGTIPVPAAFDEGGNFIRAMFGPLTLTRLTDGQPYGDYHVSAPQNGQPLFNGQINLVGGRYSTAAAVPVPLRADADGDSRVTTGIYPTVGADQLLPPSITVDDSSVVEGNAGTTSVMTFGVRLSRPVATPVDVRYYTSNGTGAGGAIGGLAACVPGVNACDFVTVANAAANTLTFAPGETFKAVSVTVKGDAIYEPAQTFSLNVALAPGETDAVIGDGQGLGTIANDEATPTISVSDASLQEPALGTANMTFTVTLTGAHEGSASAAWATQNGTATGGLLPAGQADYLIRAGVASFAATAAATQTATASVPIVADTRVEPAETFLVNLTLPVNATIVRTPGTGTIINR